MLGRQGPGSPRQTVRLASETQLHWTVRAVTADPDAVLAPARTRRRILTAALGLISALILCGAWLVGRALTREMAVSRLQSDFVTSVSHEFRTPLSSLCLMSDLLASGRVAGEADHGLRAFFDSFGGFRFGLELLGCLNSHRHSHCGLTAGPHTSPAPRPSRVAAVSATPRCRRPAANADKHVIITASCS